MRLQLGNSYLDICSSTGTIHEANGFQCDYKQNGWHDYLLEVNNSNSGLTVGVRGLYVSDQAPSPFNNVVDGSIRLHSMVLQRDETGQGDWGPNLLTRGDPDTYNYIDQRSAARLDEILQLSEKLVDTSCPVQPADALLVVGNICLQNKGPTCRVAYLVNAALVELRRGGTWQNRSRC